MIPLMHARDGQCRWIAAESSQPELRAEGTRRAKRVIVTPGPVVCGEPVRAGSSYCGCHHARVYAAGTRLTPRAAPDRSVHASQAGEERIADLVEMFG